MKKGGTGGANTNRNGLRFEKERDLLTELRRRGFVVREPEVEYGGKVIARSVAGGRLYQFLADKNINYQDYISAKLKPDEALYITDSKRLHVIEKKFQTCSGSVDEKLQTCGFKLKQYSKLLKPIGVRVTYSYVLSEWFQQPRYRDVLEYIEECGCRYYFGEVPPLDLDLPQPPR
jgi:hypothetical protein